MRQIYSIFVILWHLLSAFFPSIKHYTLSLPLFQFIPFEIHENKLSPSSPLSTTVAAAADSIVLLF